MRFHIGFSKFISIKTLIEVLGFLFVGLVAFFGLSEYLIVYADTTQYVPSSITYFRNNASGALSCTPQLQSSCTSNGGNACYFCVPDTIGGFQPFDVTYTFSAKNLCSGNSYKAKVRFGALIQNPQGTNVQGNISVTNGTISGYSYNGTYSSFYLTYYTNQTTSIILNGPEYVNYTQLSRDVTYECEYTNQDMAHDIIDSNQQNTQDIIDNQNSNTQDIIDNQNSNTQDIIDSNRVCTSRIIDNSFINDERSYLNSSGVITSSESNARFGVTDYIDLGFGTQLVSLDTTSNQSNVYSCFYTQSLSLIFCIQNTSFVTDGTVTIPSNARFVRFSISDRDNKPKFSLTSCQNGSQAIVDNFNDSNTDSSQNAGGHYFQNFGQSLDQTRGFTTIVIAPLTFLQGILSSSSSCSPLSLSFDPSDGTFGGHADWSIPCGGILWNNAPSAVTVLWHTLIYGLLGYRVLIDLVQFVNNSLDPEYKKEYVLDL